MEPLVRVVTLLTETESGGKGIHEEGIIEPETTVDEMQLMSGGLPSLIELTVVLIEKTSDGVGREEEAKKTLIPVGGRHTLPHTIYTPLNGGECNVAVLLGHGNTGRSPT